MSAKPENERERIARIIDPLPWTEGWNDMPERQAARQATSLTKADLIIAQRESGGDEPVAWRWKVAVSADRSSWRYSSRQLPGAEPLYAAPPASQALVEPVAWRWRWKLGVGFNTQKPSAWTYTEDGDCGDTELKDIEALGPIVPPASQALAEPVHGHIVDRGHTIPEGEEPIDRTDPYTAVFNSIGDAVTRYSHGIGISVERFNKTLAPRGYVVVPAEAQARVEALEVALRALADLYDTDEGTRSLPQYIAARALLSGSTPKPARVEIDDAMVDRAAVAMIRALGGTSSATIRPARYEVQAARAALTAALSGGSDAKADA